MLVPQNVQCNTVFRRFAVNFTSRRYKIYILFFTHMNYIINKIFIHRMINWLIDLPIYLSLHNNLLIICVGPKGNKTRIYPMLYKMLKIALNFHVMFLRIQCIYFNTKGKKKDLKKIYFVILIIGCTDVICNFYSLFFFNKSKIFQLIQNPFMNTSRYTVPYSIN